MEDLRQQFPILASCTYLNTAANGLVPSHVMEWRRKHDIDLIEEAGNFREHAYGHFENTKITIAQFFGASLAETGLVPNFSIGLNIVLEGLPEGQKILLLKDDYPSVIWPVETRDFNVCYAKVDENLEQNIEAAIINHRPDVFIFSIVQWLSGIKIDLDFIKRIKSYNPNLLLIADGTQYLGTENFDFHESGIDVLGASGYKWLTSGFGNGFFMIRESARDRIFLREIGFNSAENFQSKATETKFMKHFEPGHLDTLNFGSLRQSLLLMQSFGVDKLYERISSLSAIAKDRLLEHDLLAKNCTLRQNHASIFNLKLDESQYENLLKQNIICSKRGGGVRVSFHYYNSEADLHRLLECVKK